MNNHVKRVLLLCTLVGTSLAGCTAVNPDPTGGTEVTQELRDACPTLTDEVIEGFIVAIVGLQERDLSEADALTQWVDGCENIPPDGNFQGNVEACQSCLPVIVEHVYDDKTGA